MIVLPTLIIIFMGGINHQEWGKTIASYNLSTGKPRGNSGKYWKYHGNHVGKTMS